MLNSEKMSKSTEKFMTLKQAIEEFSADAMRFSLADVGDGMDDANFVVKTADAAILCLTKERTWMEEVFAAESSLRVGPPSTYADHVFANEMNFAIKMMEKTLSLLHQWACSRSFSLRTHISWDEEFLVESLSDSTIYMAYYTVYHLLQNGKLFGADTSSVKPK
nr:leucine--tRNA ligase, cytoplasmic-like [Tanacetum cinerariifolium]